VPAMFMDWDKVPIPNPFVNENESLPNLQTAGDLVALLLHNLRDQLMSPMSDGPSFI